MIGTPQRIHAGKCGQIARATGSVPVNLEAEELPQSFQGPAVEAPHHGVVGLEAGPDAALHQLPHRGVGLHHHGGADELLGLVQGLALGDELSAV